MPCWALAKAMDKDRLPSTRLFLTGPLAPGESLGLSPEQFNYLRNVLRFAAGGELLVFDGQSGEWLARYDQIGKRAGEVEILRQTRAQPAANDLWYLFAPLKHARLDYMVQKAAEMGVSQLQPVLTEYTQTSRINMERMRANVVEACEQCGVLNVPEIKEAVTLPTLLEHWSTDRRLIFCNEAAPLSDPYQRLQALGPGPLALLIGPEGGFSAKERDELLRHPFVTSLAIGPRILRADTAAVAALAILQAALGDWHSAHAQEGT